MTDNFEEMRLSCVELTDKLNTHIAVIGLLTGTEMARTKAGSDYVKISIIDQSSTLTANCWDLNLIHLPTIQASTGELIRLEGKPKTFGNNNLSFNVEKADMLTTEEMTTLGITKADFCNTVPNRSELATTLSNYLAGCKDTIYGKIAHQAIQNNWQLFNSVAAGKSVHHTAVGGLLLHTIEVIKITETFYNMSVELGYDDLCYALLITGAAIHDIGKCLEIETSALGSSEYTANSVLASHHISGIGMVMEAATQLGLQNTVECAELCHIIAAHHEKAEWGQIKEPALIEAALVSKADYLSACLNGVHIPLSKAKPGEQYQGYGYKNNWVKSMGTYNDDRAI